MFNARFAQGTGKELLAAWKLARSILAPEPVSHDAHDMKCEEGHLLNEDFEPAGIDDRNGGIGARHGGGTARTVIEQGQLAKDAAGQDGLADLAVHEDIDFAFEHRVHAIGVGTFLEEDRPGRETSDLFFTSQDMNRDHTGWFWLSWAQGSMPAIDGESSGAAGTVACTTGDICVKPRVDESTFRSRSLSAEDGQ
jgi:hypothetical protein